MDHLQSKLESNHRQTDSPELPNSNLNKEEALKEISKDHAYLPSTGEDNSPVEENKSVEMSEAATDADLEWRQFIHQELESLRNLEQVERNRMPKESKLETSSPTSLDQDFALIAEKIPFERLIESTIRSLLKKPKPNPAKKVKKYRRK